MLKPIMFAGTGSDVGKSIINAAFCRIFKQDGYNPAPFKAQNMSLNSYATPNGLEIGRAQAVQAEACEIECMVEMNPILLKPVTNQHAQLVLNGKPEGNKSALEYFNETDRDHLFREAMKSFYRLEKHFNPIVIEGAGSISEINLWDRDITNMRVACEVNADTYLVADIDRGGVFASVFGTLQLLPEKQRNLIKGIIINKFRGDIALFKDGIQMLEELTDKPVTGVIPYYRDIYIDQEDSVMLELKNRAALDSRINIAVVLLPHMSNFTDFNLLERTPGVHLYYTANANELEKADIVIIPGTKNTIKDLIFLRRHGLSRKIIEMFDAGRQIYGICGGYQMMGREVRDPYQIEGENQMMPGLGILPVVSTILKEKRTRQCEFTFMNNIKNCKGYEIHMGESEVLSSLPHVCLLGNNRKDGCFLNENVWGTYIHGIFDNAPVINHILKITGKRYETHHTMDIKEFKNEQYNKLADLVRKNIYLDSIYNSLKY